MVTIRDIAAAAAVSVSTVSNVMNNRPNVGQETRRRVLQLCGEMNYIPNPAGKNLKSGTTKTILFNFSDFDRSFYLKIIEGINDYAGAAGYDMMICTTKSCEKFMRNSITGGCIILDGRMKNEALLRAAGERYPIVALDRILESPYIKSVVVENYEPMITMMEGIVERGYRKFAFIGGPDYTDDTRERFQAFQDVLVRHGIPFGRENCFSGDYRRQSGYRGAKILMLGPDMPEIIICANDNMAIGVIAALEEGGLRVPEDMAVTGFDNSDHAEAAGLTTVAIPNYERGYLAARSLIENIEGVYNGETLKIPAAVTWRNTVGHRPAVAAF